MDTIEELPDIDERLVAPESGYEIIDGVVTFVPPADPPHAERHSKVSVLVESHAHADFNVAIDMLTRTSKIDDIAPDVSVFPRERDPVTGGRRLEQLAFEVVSTQSLAIATTKAEKLAGRGVRRVFAIDVKRERALEWSRELGTWSVLDPNGYIEDPALAVPLSVDALLHAANTDDAVARALLAKHNAVIEAVRTRDRAQAKAEGIAAGKAEGIAAGKAEGIAAGKAEGIAAGKAEMLVAILGVRGFTLRTDERARILHERDPARLDLWASRAMTCASVAELFVES